MYVCRYVFKKLRGNLKGKLCPDPFLKKKLYNRYLNDKLSKRKRKKRNKFSKRKFNKMYKPSLQHSISQGCGPKRRLESTQGANHQRRLGIAKWKNFAHCYVLGFMVVSKEDSHNFIQDGVSKRHKGILCACRNISL